jgi:hypothetical protein
MNAAGISVFYGAKEADTCIAEVRAPVGSYVVLGRFEIIRPIRLLDLDVLTKVTTDCSWFAPEFAVRSNRAAFLRHLVREISKPIMPRDEEFEYLPTQAVSEYLASCVEPPIDGINFHSAQTAREGRNVVLFHHASGVELYDLPEGAKVDVRMGGWAPEEDYDNITVCETLSRSNPAEENKPAPGVVSLKVVLERAPPDALGGERNDDAWFANPTLKLDVGKIEVFRIEAVNYQKTERRVSRYRHQES